MNASIFRRRYCRKICYVVLLFLLLNVLRLLLQHEDPPHDPTPAQATPGSQTEPESPDFIDTEAKQPVNVEKRDEEEETKLSSTAESKAAAAFDKRKALILKKMEQSMLKEGEVPLSSLIKPAEIMKSFIGPVRYKNEKTTSPSSGIKLIVVARESSGFPVLQQFFNQNTEFFQHGEVPGSLHLVPNLLNCVLDPDIIQEFKLHMAGEFGNTPYFKDQCLLDSGAICSDPLSYEKTCRKSKNQLLRTKEMSLSFIEELIKENLDIKVIFLVRDPRGGLKKKSATEMKSFCQKLLADLELSSTLERSYPGQFVVSRFEVVAGAPRNETINLLKSLNISSISLHQQNQQQSGSNDSWSPEKNSVSKINSWKQRLTMNEINRIETQCLDTLSRLEYPILGI